MISTRMNAQQQLVLYCRHRCEFYGVFENVMLLILTVKMYPKLAVHVLYVPLSETYWVCQ